MAVINIAVPVCAIKLKVSTFGACVTSFIVPGTLKLITRECNSPFFSNNPLKNDELHISTITVKMMKGLHA
ncbi:Uncharacterised protein [Streptococcus pneumoniae]|nr:Uncharacterised protein [Streptococcus pneumoniae]COR06016.1 Uncharacterised protein [Streptococcus pneumoniae]